MKKLVLSTLFMAIAASVYCQTQMTLPVTFQETNVTYNLVGFEGAEASSIVTDPTNAQNAVGKVIKSATAQPWAGTSITDVFNNVEVGFSTAIPFSATTKQMTVRVWSPDAGITVRLKTEDHLDPTHSVETNAVTTVAGQWETLTFDFANHATGTAALNLDYVFDKVTIFFNFGINGATAGEKTYYFDDVQMGSGVSTGPYNITFQVDMANVSGFTTPSINGSFNANWGNPSIPLTQVGASSVWQITIPLQAGSFEYKFTYDGWTGQETLLSGSSCTITSNGYTNRALTVSQDAVLPVVCWESCNACGLNNGPFNITFQVDMATVPGAITPYVNGPFNGWCGTCAPMTQVGSSTVYQLTIPLQPGVIEYKYSHDNVSDWETLLAGSSCTMTTGPYTNRTFTVSQDAILPVVCYGSCDACGINNGPFNVTFKVDMNQSGQTFTTPNLNGTFNNWCGPCAPMSDLNGDNIWELTIPLAADTFEYKFTYDGWTGQESLTAGSSCTITTIDGANTYTNRSIIVTAETVLDAVCWASCTPCSTGIESESSDKSNKGIIAFPNPANDRLFFNGTSVVGTTSVRIFNCIGSLVASKQFQSLSNASVEITDLKNGVYFIEIENNQSTSTQKVVVQH